MYAQCAGYFVRTFRFFSMTARTRRRIARKVNHLVTVVATTLIKDLTLKS